MSCLEIINNKMFLTLNQNNNDNLILCIVPEDLKSIDFKTLLIENQMSNLRELPTLNIYADNKTLFSKEEFIDRDRPCQ